VVVTLAAGVVRLVSGSGVDEMAGVDVLDDDTFDVLLPPPPPPPPPHTQHAWRAVVLLDPTASTKSVSHKPNVAKDAQS